MASIANITDLSLYQYVVSLALLLFTILVSGSVYRLYFHPLARYPGPKLAALTLWYELYYDGIKNGQYTFEIGRMHEKYGPIVRISPHELHVNDPSFINELYAGGGKQRDKYLFSARQFGPPQNVFSTVPHDLHRARRGALNRFFSKASVIKLEPVIAKTMRKMCAQIETYAGIGKPIELSAAFSCMTTDVVTEYAFAKSYHFLDSPTFEPNLNSAIIKGAALGIFVKQFPWILPLVKAIPVAVVSRMDPSMGDFMKFMSDIKAQLVTIIKEHTDGKERNAPHATIFHELLQADLPEEEKRLERLELEGQVLLAAGTETTAWALSVMMFYLLSDRARLSKLMDELTTAIPDASQPPSWATLEQLPYLISPPATFPPHPPSHHPSTNRQRHTAVISEGLRLSYGVCTRLQRISPLLPLHFLSTDGKFESYIPPGTPVGMTSVLIHHNPDIFPHPHSFIPERWLDDQSRQHEDRLDHYLLSFSKGSRQCLGINLAYAELYLGLAAVVRTFGSRLELFETTLADVEMRRDYFIPRPMEGSKGVRFLVREAA